MLDEKYIILIIGAILIIGGAYLYFSSTADSLKVGSSQISAPDGYEISKVSKHGGEMENNDTVITILYTDSPTNENVDNYSKKHENHTLINLTDKFGDVEVHEFELLNGKKNETKIISLFFEKNNSNYRIMVNGEYDENAVKDIVGSL